MSLAAHRAVHFVGLSDCPSMECRWPGLAPAGDLLSCFAKKVGKEGDPASPVCLSADCPALLGGSDGLQAGTEPLLWSCLLLRRVDAPVFRIVGYMQGGPSLACRWPGLAPAGDLLLCVAKEEGKKGDPAIPVVRYRGRLPCAARSRRPSRNSPAAPAQTAAPDFSACRCAARRHGTGFARLPSPCGACWCYPCTQRHAVGGLNFSCRFRRGSVLPDSPSEPPSSAVTGGAFRGCCLSRQSRRVQPRPPVASSAGESAAGRPVKPGRLLCLLSWRSKKVGRPRGRDPANVTPNNGTPFSNGKPTKSGEPCPLGATTLFHT